MDLFQNSGAGVGNMMSQRAEAQSQQAFERNKMETQKLQDSVKLAKGQVSQVGEANTMKGIQDAIVGGVLGAKVAPAVKAYRAFHNQRVALKRANLSSDNSVEGVVGKIQAETPVTQSAPKPVRPNLMLQEDEVSPAEPVKAPTPAPQEAPKPLKVVGKAGGAADEAGEEETSVPWWVLSLMSFRVVK